MAKIKNSAGGLKERLAQLKEVLSCTEKQHGKGAVMLLGDPTVTREVDVISSGSYGLDRALGTGGYPRGRVTEIYGPESSGKTTLTLHAIAEVQKRGGLCGFIDAEHALDVAYAKNLGVCPDELLLAQPDFGEQALAIAETLIMSEKLDLVVVDSVAALVPKAELDGEMSDQQVGLQARLMSKAMRKLVGVAHKTNTAIIFINQTRQKIGVAFGNPETTTGGNALKFYATVRVDVRRIGSIKEGSAHIGNLTRARVIKNKLAAPFKEAEFEIRFGAGICKAGEMLDAAVEAGLVEKSGSYFSFNGVRLGQGRNNVITAIQSDPQLEEALEKAVAAPAPNGPDSSQAA